VPAGTRVARRSQMRGKNTSASAARPHRSSGRGAASRIQRRERLSLPLPSQVCGIAPSMGRIS